MCMFPMHCLNVKQMAKWDNNVMANHATRSVQTLISFQTSLGVLSVLMWACAGRTVGAQPGLHTTQGSRNTPNTHLCSNF